MCFLAVLHVLLFSSSKIINLILLYLILNRLQLILKMTSNFSKLNLFKNHPMHKGTARIDFLNAILKALIIKKEYCLSNLKMRNFLFESLFKSHDSIVKDEEFFSKL